MKATDAKATDAEMADEKVVERDDSKYHVHRDTMIKFLELRQEYKSTAYSIPIAVLTLTSVLSVLYYRTSPWRSFPVEKALIDNIVQPDGNGVVTTDTPIAFGDIGSAGDVFDWMQNTLIPMVASETDYNGNDIDYAVGDDWYTTDKRSAFIERRMGGSCGGGGSEQCRSGRVLGYNRLFYGVMSRRRGSTRRGASRRASPSTSTTATARSTPSSCCRRVGASCSSATTSRCSTPSRPPPPRARCRIAIT